MRQTDDPVTIFPAHPDMSTALVKSKLKAAREALTKKNFQVARDAAAQVLEYEPESYNAYVPRTSFISY